MFLPLGELSFARAVVFLNSGRLRELRAWRRMPVLWVVASALISRDILVGELSKTSVVIFLIDFLDS